MLPSSRLPAPDPVAAAHAARVAEHLAAAIDAAGGWLRFDRFMDLVLFAPGLGYYAAGAAKIGPLGAGGDFVTAPELSPLLARALARELAPVLRATAPAIVEFGAGSGALAAELLPALRDLGLDPVRYAIVEVSPDLRARQQARLAGLPVAWLDAPPPGFVGAVLANEVLDVMPVRLFVLRGGTVAERGVVRGPGGALGWAERPADAPLAAAVEAIVAATGPLPEGYGSELGAIARAWVASLGDWLAHGVAWLIDYGFPAREYYHPQRAMGTLMCHFRHRAHADPLWWPGLNDLTAHLDFSALAEAAHGAGLQVLGYTSQARFLLNLGAAADLAAADPAARARGLRLVSEAEMGELFKVLALGRGYDAPLAGFARGDRRHAL